MIANKSNVPNLAVRLSGLPLPWTRNWLFSWADDVFKLARRMPIIVGLGSGGDLKDHSDSPGGPTCELLFPLLRLVSELLILIANSAGCCCIVCNGYLLRGNLCSCFPPLPD